MLKKLCNHPGCINYREEGSKYCTKHLSDAQMDFTGYQQPWAHLYHTTEWTKIKRDLLKGPCAICDINQATEVHHIIPHRGNEDLFFDHDNLLPVCHQCHMKLTAKEIAGRRADIQQGSETSEANCE